MSIERLVPLRFDEAYLERIWGGAKLRALYGKPIPTDKPIGEAWLIADHPVHESVVVEGPHRGRTLRSLIEADPEGVLGSRAELTHRARFPLLLKLIDAREALSVQVHPDDACAADLGEDDVGKTEMWHVLQADPNAELICGLEPAVTPDMLASMKDQRWIEPLMKRFPVTEGASVFVRAGTIHAIGAGLVLAEIQENSNLTYRLYDWGRTDSNGEPRPLHLGKALQAIHFGSLHGGITQPLDYSLESGTCTVLAACRYFAAELVMIAGTHSRKTCGETFHIILGRNGDLSVNDTPLKPGQALLVPGSATEFIVSGSGAYLDYYVPDIERDITMPLLNSGHLGTKIASLFHA